MNFKSSDQLDVLKPVLKKQNLSKVSKTPPENQEEITQTQGNLDDQLQEKIAQAFDIIYNFKDQLNKSDSKSLNQ